MINGVSSGVGGGDCSVGGGDCSGGACLLWWVGDGVNICGGEEEENEGVSGKGGFW